MGSKAKRQGCVSAAECLETKNQNKSPLVLGYILSLNRKKIEQECNVSQKCYVIRKSQVVFGRNGDIVLGGNSVSRKHAKISGFLRKERDGLQVAQVQIENTSVKRPLTVNSNLVQNPTILEDGAIVKVGVLYGFKWLCDGDKLPKGVELIYIDPNNANEYVMLEDPLESSKLSLPTVCWRCKIDFKTVEKLRLHADNAANPKPFKCLKCCASFGHGVTLDNHVKHCKGKLLENMDVNNSQPFEVVSLVESPASVSSSSTPSTVGEKKSVRFHIPANRYKRTFSRGSSPTKKRLRTNNQPTHPKNPPVELNPATLSTVETSPLNNNSSAEQRTVFSEDETSQEMGKERSQEANQEANQETGGQSPVGPVLDNNNVVASAPRAENVLIPSTIPLTTNQDYENMAPSPSPVKTGLSQTSSVQISDTINVDEQEWPQTAQPIASNINNPFEDNPASEVVSQMSSQTTAPATSQTTSPPPLPSSPLPTPTVTSFNYSLQFLLKVWNVTSKYGLAHNPQIFNEKEEALFETVLTTLHPTSTPIWDIVKIIEATPEKDLGPQIVGVVLFDYLCQISLDQIIELFNIIKLLPQEGKMAPRLYEFLIETVTLFKIKTYLLGLRCGRVLMAQNLISQLTPFPGKYTLEKEIYDMLTKTFTNKVTDPEHVKIDQLALLRNTIEEFLLEEGSIFINHMFGTEKDPSRFKFIDDEAPIAKWKAKSRYWQRFIDDVMTPLSQYLFPRDLLHAVLKKARDCGIGTVGYCEIRLRDDPSIPRCIFLHPEVIQKFAADSNACINGSSSSSSTVAHQRSKIQCSIQASVKDVAIFKHLLYQRNAIEDMTQYVSYAVYEIAKSIKIPNIWCFLFPRGFNIAKIKYKEDVLRIALDINKEDVVMEFASGFSLFFPKEDWKLSLNNLTEDEIVRFLSSKALQIEEIERYKLLLAWSFHKCNKGMAISWIDFSDIQFDREVADVFQNVYPGLIRMDSLKNSFRILSRQQFIPAKDFDDLNLSVSTEMDTSDPEPFQSASSLSRMEF